MPGCHVQPEQMFNLIFGYKATWDETPSAVSPGADTDASTGVVPAGQLWVATHVSAYHSDPAARSVLIGIERPAGFVAFLRTTGVAAWNLVERNVWWVFPATYYATARCEALANAQTVFLNVTGFKMVLSQ